MLLAHHQDDNIETYLMQKQRKNLVKFYGIKEKTHIFGVNIRRPLLNYSKQDLLLYCQNNPNLQNVYLRNRIRHEIVSKMSNEERNNILNEMLAKNYYLEHLFASFVTLNLHSFDTLISLDDIEFAYALNLLAEPFHISISFKQCLEVS